MIFKNKQRFSAEINLEPEKDELKAVG